MTSYPFLKMTDGVNQYYFRFRICWCNCLQEIKIYEHTKFHHYISIHGWDITTAVLEKQTSAILEFYFRFRPGLFRRNLHIIMHQAAEFRANRSSYCGNMTSYPLLKCMACSRSMLIRDFVFVDVAAFRRSKSISKPNLVDISPFTAEILLFPVRKNERPPYWNSTSGYDLDHFAVIGVLFCIRRQISSKLDYPPR